MNKKFGSLSIEPIIIESENTIQVGEVWLIKTSDRFFVGKVAEPLTKTQITLKPCLNFRTIGVYVDSVTWSGPGERDIFQPFYGKWVGMTSQIQWMAECDPAVWNSQLERLPVK